MRVLFTGMAAGIRKAGGAALLALAFFFCLLSTVPRQAQATYPGRPGVIVFNHIPRLDSNGNYVGGLYAIHPQWKSPRQLTDNPWDDEASFAPSGQRLVFRRSFGPQPGIYALDLRSGKTRGLTREQADRSPAFGPRGRVVFSRLSPQRESYDLFLRTPAGRLRRLTSTPADDVDPVFTPDGSQIFFTQDHLGGYSSDEPPPPPKISSVRVGGGGLRDIAGLTKASRVDISPDGRDLVFQRSQTLSDSIWTKRLGGGKPKLIAENALIPVYSPEGEEIAYSMFRVLRLISADGNSDSRLLSDWDAVSFHLDGKLFTEPAWQPLPPRR